MRQMLQLVKEAKTRFGEISYCGKALSWKECTTIDNGYLMLWFNVGKNTHMLRTPVLKTKD